MPKKLELKAIFKAVDKVSRPMGKMQKRIVKFTKRARAAVKRLDRAMSALARGIGRGLKMGLIAGAAALTVFGVAVKSVADKMDNLAKISRRLEFDIEALQEWGFVAEQAGMTSEDFQKSIGKFAKNIGDMKLGTGSLYTVFKKNNKEMLKTLSNTESVDEAFNTFITALENTTDPMKRAALAQAAFGRSGMGMVNVAKLGSEEIKKLRQEMRDNGIVTMDTAKDAEAFNDALNSAKLAVQGLLFKALGPLLPDLEKLLRSFREWIVINKDLIKQKTKEFFEKIVGGVKVLAAKLKELQDKHDILGMIADGFKLLGRAIEFILDNKEAIAKIAVAILAIAGAVKVLGAVMTAVNFIAMLNPMVLAFAAAVIGIAAFVHSITTHWEDLKNAFSWLWDDIKDTFSGAIGAILSGPAGMFKLLADGIMQSWDPTKGFFENLWNGIVNVFKSAFTEIKAVITNLANLLGDSTLGPLLTAIGGPLAGILSTGSSLLGFGEQSTGEAAAAALNPTDRIMNMFSDTTTTNKSEVTIKDETGRAEVTSGALGTGLTMQPTGSF